MGKSGDLESRNDHLIDKILDDPLYKFTKDGKAYSKLTLNGQGIQDDWREIGYHKADGYVRFRYQDEFLFLHRVIFRKYKGKLEKDMTINHKDGDKSNNAAGNLEMVAHVDNNIHKWKMKNGYLLNEINKISFILKNSEDLSILKRGAPKLFNILDKPYLSWDDVKIEGEYISRTTGEATWKSAYLKGTLNEDTLLINITKHDNRFEYVIKYKNKEYSAKNQEDLESTLNNLKEGNLDNIDFIETVYENIKDHKKFIFDTINKAYLKKIHEAWDYKIYYEPGTIYLRFFLNTTENRREIIDFLKKYKVLDKLKEYFKKVLEGLKVEVDKIEIGGNFILTEDAGFTITLSKKISEERCLNARLASSSSTVRTLIL